MEIYRGCESSCSFARDNLFQMKRMALIFLFLFEKFLKDLVDTFPYPVNYLFWGMGEPFYILK